MTSQPFKSIREFDKDIERLSKKYPHFDDDFETFKNALLAELPNRTRGTKRISGLGSVIKIPIYKVRKFYSTDCKGRGAKSGFRIIYAHNLDTKQIIFIEAYQKNKQSNEDRKRIYKYFKLIEKL